MTCGRPISLLPYSRFNRGHHYILTVIDVLSKYTWTVPIKSKGGNETAEAVAWIIRESERCPKNLQTDMGKEFYNVDVKRLVKKHGINHYSMYSMLKASVVEQFNRTLKNNMWKILHSTEISGSTRCRVSCQITTRASDRMIGMRPVDVTPAVAEKFLITVYNRVKIAEPTKFKVGDSVCVSKYKTIFEKGYTPNWTTEVFKIVKVQRTNPVTYLLEDYRGKSVAEAFYEYELLRAADPDVYLVEKILRGRGDKVKWLGFDNLYNSWIQKDNVI